MNCPKCGREMLDQRASKKNPKQPDYTCSDPNCLNEKGYRTGVWEQKPNTSRPAQSPAAPRAPRWTWPQLSVLYGRSLSVARKHVETQLPNATAADTIAATATIFIAASRDGVAELEKQQPLHEKPKALAEQPDDDLPF